MHTGSHGGTSRSFVRLFALTHPDPERATRWLRGVGDAIAHHVAAALLVAR
jgi:hypothetical protein